MTASKYKHSFQKKLKSEHDAALSSLRRENTYLKKILMELSHQHSQHYKLVEGFLSLEVLRLGNSQHARVEPQHQNDASSVDGDSVACEHSSTTDEDVTDLRKLLRDVLEKNQRWLEYFQQREAYVKEIQDRMSWLENHLKEANQARSQQHNEAHSDEKERLSQMQEHYEKLLQKVKEELEVLREQVDVTHQDLMITQARCKEKEEEVEELRQQLESERKSKEEQDDPDSSELSNESEDLQIGLDTENRRLDSVKLQAKVFQKVMLCHQVPDQKKIADLQRQIEISSQELQDERQNCSHLKRKLVKVLKMLQKDKETAAEQPQRDLPAHCSYEEVYPTWEFTMDEVTLTNQRSLLDESFLECPKCQVKYPASHHRELLTHIDICLI